MPSLVGACCITFCVLTLCQATKIPSAAWVPPHSQARRVLSSRNDSAALLVPLTAGRHGPLYRGRRMRAASLDVAGSVRDVGYFFVTLSLGTPSKSFQLIIDTGSTVTYVPCSDCKHCGQHQGQPFDIKASTSALELSCNTPKCNCGSPACQCFQNKCFYARSYAERSSSDGFLLEDVMAFPDVPGSLSSADAPPPPVRIVFGCERSETGEIYKQTADGIMGLGNNNNALQSQLVEQRIIDDTFSLCFGFPDSGTMLLGDVRLDRVAKFAYTPLKPSWQTHYYTVVIGTISVDGQTLDVPMESYSAGYGAVLDSGTTFAYLPTAAFNAFAKSVDKAVQAKGLTRRPGADPQYPDICWTGAPPDPWDLSDAFPQAEVTFDGGAVLHLKPLQYLFVLGNGAYCLGVFDNGNQGTLLGGIFVRNVLVQYDRRNSRAGFLPLSSCDDVNKLVTDAWSPAASPAPQPSSPSQPPSQPQSQSSPPQVPPPQEQPPNPVQSVPWPPPPATPQTSSPAPGNTPAQEDSGSSPSGSPSSPGNEPQPSSNPGSSESAASSGGGWRWVVVVLVLALIGVIALAAWREPERFQAIWQRVRSGGGGGGGGGGRDVEESIALIDKSGAATELGAASGARAL